LKQNLKKLSILLTMLVISSLAGGIWWKLRYNRKSNEPVHSTASVIRRDFSSSVLATGAVRPQVGAEVRVGARISGKVERLLANIGDFVKKGQILAELEKADLSAVVEQRNAELVMAEARMSEVETLRPREIKKAETDVARWQATMEFSKKELARENDLLGRDFTSQQARDQAQEKFSVAAAQYNAAIEVLDLARKKYTEDIKQAKAEIAITKAVLSNAEVRLSYATITAPISGVIASVATQEGETVAAGLNAPTFVTIIDLKRLQVDAYVDEVDIGKIRSGQEAVFTVDAFPAKEFNGKVTAIYPKAVIQENVVNYDVVIDITDAYDGLLRPEMTASVTISLEKRKQALAVPAKAVKRKQGKNVVYIMTKTGLETRQVKIGWKDGQWIEIVVGVKEGQAVLLEKPIRKTKRSLP